MSPSKNENNLASIDAGNATRVMGILNVTPDSFSDGGDHDTVEAAVARAQQMIEEGANIIDVGPESTRPGSVSISADEQINRGVPVILELHRRCPSATISIDTRLARVAKAAIDAGATMINDTAALRDDEELVAIAAKSGVQIVLMHRRGTPATMQQGGGPEYDDVIEEICRFLQARIAFAERSGIAKEKIVIDPGLGFGKRMEDNVRIMQNIEAFVALGRPVLIGASRKNFLGKLSGGKEPKQRLAASLACAIKAVDSGASIVRVHDVRETVEALAAWSVMRKGPSQNT